MEVAMVPATPRLADVSNHPDEPAYATMMGNLLSGKPVEVAPGLAILQLSLVNVYLVGEANAPDRNWVLVDAGLSFSAPWIRKAAAERFGPDSRPAAIHLTHGHFDHVGALVDLAKEWDVPIFAHPLEMPYLTGRSSYPPADPAVGGGAMAFLSSLYPRGPINVSDRVRELPPDGTVPYMPGWRWVPSPGHSPGHVSFFRDSDRTLIAGDAFVTVKQESLFAVLTPNVMCADRRRTTPSIGIRPAFPPNVSLASNRRWRQRDMAFRCTAPRCVASSGIWWAPGSVKQCRRMVAMSAIPR